MTFKNVGISAGFLTSLASAAALSPRQDVSTVTVDLSVDRGAPNHYGSGVLLGIPDDAWPGMNVDQIPNEFYERMAFRYNRGGASQLPGTGWTTGLEGYTARIESTKAAYDKTRSFGAPFVSVMGTSQLIDLLHL